MIYMESYTRLICFQWLVKKQEWRQSKSLSQAQRSVVKDKMTKQFTIQPIAIMLGSTHQQTNDDAQEIDLEAQE